MARFGNMALMASDGQGQATGEEDILGNWWSNYGGKITGKDIEGSPLRDMFKGGVDNSPSTGSLMADAKSAPMWDKFKSAGESNPMLMMGLLGKLGNLGQQKYTDKLTQVQLATAPFSKTSVGDMTKLMKMSSAGINPIQELQQLREIEDMRRERDQRLANSTRYLDILEASLKKDK